MAARYVYDDPVCGMSWIYDEFFEPWENDHLDPEDVRVVVVDMDDNPHLSEQGKKIALQGLSREERQARKSGRFVSFAGLIYPNFSVLRHVIPDEDSLPENVELFERAFILGCGTWRLWCSCHGDEMDRLVVYDELAVQGRTVAEVAKAVKGPREQWASLLSRTGFRSIRRPVGGTLRRAGSISREYLDSGIVSFPGKNDVRAGINRSWERLEADPLKLVISSRCTELRGELEG